MWRPGGSLIEPLIWILHDYIVFFGEDEGWQWVQKIDKLKFDSIPIFSNFYYVYRALQFVCFFNYALQVFWCSFLPWKSYSCLYLLVLLQVVVDILVDPTCLLGMDALLLFIEAGDSSLHHPEAGHFYLQLHPSSIGLWGVVVLSLRLLCWCSQHWWVLCLEKPHGGTMTKSTLNRCQVTQRMLECLLLIAK